MSDLTVKIEAQAARIAELEAAQSVVVKPLLGPQPKNRPLTCKGCSAFSEERWREPSGDGETYDSGTYNRCAESEGKLIDGVYGSIHPIVPDWCPHKALQSAPATVQQAALIKALDEIRELNTTGRDENGHKWANSDLIEQTIVAALSTKEDGNG